MKITFVLTNKGHFDTCEAVFPTYGDFRMANEVMKPAIEMAYNTVTGEVLYLKSQNRGV